MKIREMIEKLQKLERRYPSQEVCVVIKTRDLGIPAMIPIDHIGIAEQKIKTNYIHTITLHINGG